MAKIKKLTIREYAELAGVHVSGVRRNITKGWNAPGVSECHKVGTTWLLTVDVSAMRRGKNLKRKIVA